MNPLDIRFDLALTLAMEAGELAMRMRPEPGAPGITFKGAQDWLTEADGAVEKFLSESLEDAFPEDGFQGEEGGSARTGLLRWVVDPIDGTANYARGGSRFCVSLALLRDRTPLLGILVAPATEEVFAARNGQGATLNNESIRVAGTGSLDRAIVELGWNPRRSDADFAAALARLRRCGVAPRIGGSGAMGMADVAAGRIDAYGELDINLWDCAAAIVICVEAGAHVSPFMQGHGPERGGPILACAPALANKLSWLTED